MKKIYVFARIFTLVVALFAVVSCKKDDDTGNISPIASTEKVTTTVAGRLTNETGSVVSGATITLAGQTTSSDPLGLFVFKNIEVEKSRCFLTITQHGFIKQTYGFHPSKGNVTYVKPVLLAYENTQSVDASNGGTLTLNGGGSVSFPANAFVNENGAAYTGPVTVKTYLLNKDDDHFATKIPGRDLRAINSEGKQKILVSYGMMNVELYDASSQKLNLAPGKTAILTFPIPASQMVSAPAVMPSWSFDEEKALWNEEGTAVKNGNNYIIEAQHFTWWNCDLQYDLAYISGSVTGCSNGPVANMEIYVDWTLGYVTDNTGHFEGDAPAGYGGFEIYGGINYEQVTSSGIVPDLAAAQNFVVPPLVVDSLSNYYEVLSGTLTDCNGNASDGFVVFYNAAMGFTDYCYAINGNYSIVLNSGNDYEITAMNNGYYGQLNYTTGNAPCAIDIIPNIQICNQISGTTNNFSVTLTSTVFGTQSMAYDVNDCVVYTSPYTSITLQGQDTVNNSYGAFSSALSAYATGTYTWNTTNIGITFDAQLNGIDVEILSLPGGITQVMSAPPVGGLVNVNFNGNVTINSTGFPAPIPATISGSYSVIRNL